MKKYLHSKQMADLLKANKIGSNDVWDYTVNDGLPYPGVFSFPDEIIDPIEVAANRRGRDWVISNYDVKERK